MAGGGLLGRPILGNDARPGRTTRPGVVAEISDAAGRAARALSGNGARAGRATRFGLLLPIPLAPGFRKARPVRWLTRKGNAVLERVRAKW